MSDHEAMTDDGPLARMHRLPWTQTIGLLAPAAGFSVLCVFMLVTGRSAMYAVWLPFALILLVIPGSQLLAYPILWIIMPGE